MSQMLTISIIELYMHGSKEHTNSSNLVYVLALGCYRVAELLPFEISQYIICFWKTNYKWIDVLNYHFVQK